MTWEDGGLGQRDFGLCWEGERGGGQIIYSSYFGYNFIYVVHIKPIYFEKCEK